MSPARPRVESAAIHEVVLPLLRPHRTAGTEIARRRLLILRLTSGGLDGWGECGPVPGYSAETYEDCRTWLTESALPGLLAGGVPPIPVPPAAGFAVETALADLDARRTGSPLWRALGGTRERIEVGAVIGLDVPTAGLPAAAESLAGEGYHRIKLKVAPGRDRDRVAAVRAALPAAELAVDANGSYPPSEPPYLLDGFGLSFVEQPFPAGEWRASEDLARTIETPICLDESIDGIEAAVRALDGGAASVLNVKPARLGGLAAAVAVHDVASARGAPVWCGGMLESGIGRAAALAVASLPGMSLPADLPPSGRHFAEDLVTQWMEHGTIHPGGGPGLGVRPDPAVLERYSVRSLAFDGS